MVLHGPEVADDDLPRPAVRPYPTRYVSPWLLKAGTTVTWKNEDDIPHTVVSTTKAFRSKALDTDDSFSFTFTTPGTYEYFCSLHPHMVGTVVVDPADGADKPSP